MRDIQRTLALMLEPGSVAELRAPLAGRKGADAGYFDDFAKLAQEANRMSGNYPAVYMTLNPCDPALLSRAYNRVKKWATDTTTDSQIMRRRNMLIDADATRPGGISSTNEEHEAAIARVRQIAANLTACGWPAPLLADSGNGGHLVYRIDLPADDTRVQKVLKALATKYDDDVIKIDTSVYNPARITKVYGTLACKGDNTPTRPHRWARILEAPDTLAPVSVAMLDALLNEPAPKEPSTSIKITRSDGFDLTAWMQRYAPDATGPEPWESDGLVWTFAVCPWRPEDTGATAYVSQRAGKGIKAACQHATCPGSKATGNHWRELRELREPGCYNKDSWQEEPEWLSDAPHDEEPEYHSHPTAARLESTAPPPGYVTLSAVGAFYGSVTWAWPKWIPRGHVTMIAGPQGTGKSYLAAYLAAVFVGVARSWPDAQTYKGDTGPVVLCDTEDMRGVYAERLAALGVLDGAVLLPSRGDDVTYRPEMPRDMDHIERLAKAHGAKTIIVDSLSGGHAMDENSAMMRKILQGLTGLAANLQIPVIVVHHTRKRNAQEAVRLTLDRVRGSSAISQFCRSVIGLYRMTETDLNADVRIEPLKASFCKPADALGMAIGDQGLEWVDPPNADGKIAQPGNRAQAFLLDVLADGPMRYVALQTLADDLSIGKGALYAARDALGITADLAGWRLPSSGGGIALGKKDITESSERQERGNAGNAGNAETSESAETSERSERLSGFPAFPVSRGGYENGNDDVQREAGLLLSGTGRR